jgi:CheY-like chemotaxis protein
MKRILLAEDNENDVELTLSALAECRLANEVDVVRDGAEALDYIYSRGNFADRGHDLPGVVLLDLKMPRVDGLEVLRTIKSDSKLRTLPIVMLTSSREEQDLLRSYHSGVNAFVVKPVDFAQFVAAIRTLGIFWSILNELPSGRPKRA